MKRFKLEHHLFNCFFKLNEHIDELLDDYSSLDLHKIESFGRLTTGGPHIRRATKEAFINQITK